MIVPVGDGLVLSVRDEGPRRGEAVLLLHGFPQDGSCWDRVVPQLHAGGLRTLAPDQRGYAVAARPSDIGSYDVDALVADALAVLDAAGCDRAHVVGHDWGGALAWQLAAQHPGRVLSATVLSTPHPAAMAEAIVRSVQQPLMSWYTVAFQAPVLPEAALTWLLPAVLRRSGLPAEDAARYASRLSRVRDLRGPLGWYRAAARRAVDPRRSSDPGPALVPTTYVWGRRDPALGRCAAERTRLHVEGPYWFVELDEGHWLPECRPDEVAEVVLRRATAGRAHSS